MPSVLVKEFILSLHIDSFLELFWKNKQYCVDFLNDKLLNLNIDVSEWQPSNDSSAISTRTIKSHHPSKFSFPGLPSHSESWKNQTMEIIMQNDCVVEKVTIKEVNCLKGIPYADYFNINTEWVITSANDATSSRDVCKGRIYLEVQFLKSTWLQGTIEANTKAEIIAIYDLWLENAQVVMRRSIDNNLNIVKHQSRRSLSNASSIPSIHHNNNNSSNQVVVAIVGVEDVGSGELQPLLSSEYIEVSPIPLSNKEQQGGGDGECDEDPYYYYSDYEELDFYDCEDGKNYIAAGYSGDDPSRRYYSNSNKGGGGGGVQRQHVSMRRSSYKHGSTNNNNNSAGGGGGSKRYSARIRSKEALKASNNILSAELQQYYEQPHSKESSNVLALHNESEDDDISLGELSVGSSTIGSSQTSPSAIVRNTHDLVANIVETIFVFSEFSYWQIHNFYSIDMKELFDIEPDKVCSRILNSFLPGLHVPILVHPDLYGPLLAVFTLPQSLLICMETSRNGCNPTSQLGNAVVMCLFIWLGLSFLFRILAMVIAPSIELKHCISMTGYGFYAWNFAILGSFLLVNYYDTLQIPTIVPLVIFGLPSSISQGLLFWELTPASNMTTHNLMLSSTLSPSIQQFVTNHNRCFQRMLWAFPKIIAFVVVAGTHYQFLWYIFRVFLPGTRQLCQLSRLVQPSQYADILTQKEFRNFAISLLTGKPSS